MCGEKSGFCQRSILHLGSPPRMRGKVLYRSGPDAGGRITPAYAGKSYTRTCYAYNVRDHPRVCGEKVGMGYRGKAPVGSPPRMRGKVTNLFEFFLSGRITPAYAGKRHTGGMWVPGNTDHPRVCGEKKVEPLRVTPSLGSPPRMRGKVPPGRDGCCTAGITPAYAGKSTPSRCSWACIRDHPRVCGEKLF